MPAFKHVEMYHVCGLALKDHSQILPLDWLYGNVHSGSYLLSKKKPAPDYTFVSKVCETDGYKSRGNVFLAEILWSLELETQNETLGGSEYIHSHRKEHFQTKSCEMKLPMALEEIDTQKLKTNQNAFLSVLILPKIPLSSLGNTSC